MATNDFSSPRSDGRTAVPPDARQAMYRRRGPSKVSDTGVRYRSPAGYPTQAISRSIDATMPACVALMILGAAVVPDDGRAARDEPRHQRACERERRPVVRLDDEVVAGACLTHDGTVRHEPTRDSLATDKQGKN